MFPVYVQLCLYVHISSKMIVWSKTQAIRFFLFHSALQIMVLNIYFFATFFIAQCSGTRRKLPLCRSRKYHSPSLPEGIGISRGWGFCETKILKKHNSNKKNSFHGGGMDIFLNYTFPLQGNVFGLNFPPTAMDSSLLYFPYKFWLVISPPLQRSSDSTLDGYGHFWLWREYEAKIEKKSWLLYCKDNHFLINCLTVALIKFIRQNGVSFQRELFWSSHLSRVHRYM